MIAAFARAARVLAGGGALGQDTADDPGRRHMASALRAAAFLRASLWDEARQVLRRRYRQESAAIDGYAEDYAYVIFGLLELFQASGDAAWLEWAIALQQRQDALFWDPVEHAWFSTTGADDSVLLRMKEEYDGAEPSASAVGAWNLVTLAHLTGDSAYHDRARDVFAAYGARLAAQGRGMPMMAAALAASLAPPEQIVIVGDAESPVAAALWAAAHRPYRPFATMVWLVPGPRQERIARRMPWVAAMTLRDGQAAAYVCRNFVCEAPTTRAADLVPPRGAGQTNTVTSEAEPYRHARRSEAEPR